MKILIACEFSGIVRDAFIKQGFNAVSCDLLATERKGPHLQCDVFEAIHSGQWDAMLAFPPCTFLCNSGVKHLYMDGRRVNGRNLSRWEDMRIAAVFFRNLFEAPIKHIAIENPIMHGYAADIIGYARTQLVQPWQFGHGEIKATGFHLRNLPKLQPTNIVEGRRPRVHHASPGLDRWKERSRFLPGMAEAMAIQWGNYIKGDT